MKTQNVGSYGIKFIFWNLQVVVVKRMSILIKSRVQFDYFRQWSLFCLFTLTLLYHLYLHHYIYSSTEEADKTSQKEHAASHPIMNSRGSLTFSTTMLNVSWVMIGGGCYLNKELPHHFQQLCRLCATLMVNVIQCQCVVWLHKDMLAPQVWQEVPESQVDSMQLQHIDVCSSVLHRPPPMACPALPHCTPTCRACICGDNLPSRWSKTYRNTSEHVDPARAQRHCSDTLSFL